MWDYDKLFAEGNIIGIKNCYENFISNQVVDFEEPAFWLEGYKNSDLSCKKQHVAIEEIYSYTTDFEIQYIIRLDEHGNVVEKLFDRERDMPKPMPELETGMFVRVGEHKDNMLGFIDAENNHIIYQEGGYDFINSIGIFDGVASAIIEVYGKDTLGFRYCRNDEVIWRSPEYQAYLDSKSN